MPDYFDKALKRARIESQIDDIISEAKDAFPYTPPRPYTNTNDLGTLAGAAGIGAANMVNDTVFGGGGLVLGDIGRGVEYKSPLSGRDENMVHELTNAGFTEEEINQLVPYIDSWVTSLAKKSLDTHNYFSGHLTDWRNQLLGDNPTFAARVAEGAGSSLGFMGLGYLGAGLAAAPGWAGLIGAGISGGLESLSEAGGFLGDAYANGMYDKGLGVANQSLLANAGLNIGLDLLTGPFSPYTRGTINPYKRFIYGTLGEVANELLQEPSQQVIEQAATNSLNKNSDFFSLSNFKNNELVNSFLGRNEYQGQGWTDMFNQLAPEVALSTLLTQALIGASGILTPSGRQNIKDQHDASQNLSKMGINTVQQGENILIISLNSSRNCNRNLPTLQHPTLTLISTTAQEFRN